LLARPTQPRLTTRETETSSRSDRCETCRFWFPETSECRRRAPSVLSLSLAPVPGADAADAAAAGVGTFGAWPVTAADGWCGEWSAPAERSAPSGPELDPAGAGVATRLFLARVAPTLDAHDPPALLAALLDQLPADVRQVLVRNNGLDGRPPAGLRDMAREFKMSHGHIRALLATGEAMLTEVVRLLSRPRQRD
jgi:hypothetical protein